MNIAPPSFAMRDFSTPYGPIAVALHAGVVVAHDVQAPQALAYAAKEAGATRIIELVQAQPADRLLPSIALVLPHDLVDLTNGRGQTLFVGKGYGFISQNPAFCPETRAALLQAAVAQQPLTFARGIVGIVAPGQHLAPDQARLWNIHLTSTGIAPLCYFCKELELCYAPLCIVGAVPDVAGIIDAAVAALPAARACPCATTMQPARARGLVSDDWRTWL